MLVRLLVALGILFVLLGMLIAFCVLANEVRADSGVVEDLRRTVYVEVEYLEYQHLEPLPQIFPAWPGVMHQFVPYRTSAEDFYRVESLGCMPVRNHLGKLARKDHILFWHLGRLWHIRYLVWDETTDYEDHDTLYHAKNNWYNLLREAWESAP